MALAAKANRSRYYALECNLASSAPAFG